MRPLALALALVAYIAIPIASARAADRTRDAAAQACEGLSARVDAMPGIEGVFLRSFESASGTGPVDESSVATAAFVYDNAAATIALVACDRVSQAARIGSALLAATNTDGRLYNAYTAGPVSATPKPNGWWSAAENRWLQDGYQMGTATGNMAWAALALLTLSERTHDPRWCAGAKRLGTWVADHAHTMTGAGGFGGGVFGFEGRQTSLDWKSTEHNIDLAAAFARLARCDASPNWPRYAKEARAFVDAQWDAADGHFLVGTLPDGVTPNRATSALDVQFWSQMLPDAPPDWRRALDYAERAHGVGDGFSFNAERHGVWVEGTAQAALAYRLTNRASDAERLLHALRGDFAANGLAFATRGGEIRTGLAVSPTSTGDDFHYYHWPHIGATAWIALAAQGWNPFTGTRKAKP